MGSNEGEVRETGLPTLSFLLRIDPCLPALESRRLPFGKGRIHTPVGGQLLQAFAVFVAEGDARFAVFLLPGPSLPVRISPSSWASSALRPALVKSAAIKVCMAAAGMRMPCLGGMLRRLLSLWRNWSSFMGFRYRARGGVGGRGRAWARSMPPGSRRGRRGRESAG